MTASLAPGQPFARDFVLLRPLGRGGSGVVWVARQESTGRERALKVFSPLSGGGREPERLARSRARFVQEARIGAQIRSPHVVEVVAAGVADDGETPWLAMELLQGEDLAARIARAGPLSRAECAALFVQLTAAMGAAHAAGVLHLDLKPENVFLCTSAREGDPFALKVLDFGIGRMMREMRDAVTVTSAAGSPLWMAPEQSIEQQRVSTATDIWPMGLMAFRALTGRHFWRTGNAAEVSFAAWVLEMMTEEIPAASARAAALGLDRALPPGFDAWFARCVARDVNARWRSVDELLRGLLPVLEGRALAPSPPSASAPRRARRWALAGVAGLTAAAVATGAWHLLRAPTSPETPPPTSLPAAERAGDLRVQVGAGTAFWHHDGRCVARVSYALRNTGATPVELRRRSFSVRGMSVVEELSTLPASISLSSGDEARGDLAWACEGPALPSVLTAVFAAPGPVPPLVSTRALTQAPTEPASGASPSRGASAMALRVLGDATASSHGGEVRVRVEVELTNPVDAPLRVYRAHFALRANGASARVDGAASTWADPQTLPPGGSARGVLVFVIAGDPGPSLREVTVAFAPATSSPTERAVRVVPEAAR